MQLGIAMLLPDGVHNAVRRYQLAIANACGGNPALKQHPHITLKQPFHAKELSPVENYFDALVASLVPLRLELREMDRFEEDRVVFIDVVRTSELEHLRQDVLTELHTRFRVAPRDVEGDGYRLHVTLAYGLTPEAFEQAWGVVADQDPRFDFELDALGLFYYTGEEWILYKRSQLRA